MRHRRSGEDEQLSASSALWQTYRSVGLARGISGKLTRLSLPPEALPVMSDQAIMQLHGIGDMGLKEIRAYWPYAGSVVRVVRPNLDVFSVAQWTELAIIAEERGFGDKRLSDLPALVQSGSLPWPASP